MINHKAYVEQALAHTLELPVNAWGALGPGRPAPCGRRLLIIQRLSQLSNVVRCCAVQNYPSAESWRWYLWPTRQAAPGQTHFEPFPNSFELLQIFWALFGITTTENVKPASDNARQASEVERLVSEGRVLHYSYRSIRGYLRCSQCKTAPHFSVGEENLKLGQMWRQNLAHPCAAHSWHRSEKRATFTPTENLWLHGEWWVGFFGGSSGPFHVSCSAVCNYGGMQADRYHLTPAAPTRICHCYTYKTGRRNTQKRPEMFSDEYKGCHNVTAT